MDMPMEPRSDSGGMNGHHSAAMTPNVTLPTPFNPEQWLANKNLNSILLAHPEEVASWPETYGYSNDESSLVIQYFVQLNQVFPSKTQQITQQVLTKRASSLIEQQQWHLLHEHDPLRVFDEVRRKDGHIIRRRGIPPMGYVLGGNSALVQNEQFTKGQQGYQIPGYPGSWQPLPIGTSLIEILQQFPNHLTYEFLDAFLQHGVTSGKMLDVMPGQIVKSFLDKGLMTDKSASNVFLKRLKARRRVLVNAVGFNTDGINKLEQYLSSPIKLFAVGVTSSSKQLSTGQCKFRRVDDFREQLRRQSADAVETVAPTHVEDIEKRQIVRNEESLFQSDSINGSNSAQSAQSRDAPAPLAASSRKSQPFATTKRKRKVEASAKSLSHPLTSDLRFQAAKIQTPISPERRPESLPMRGELIVPGGRQNFIACIKTFRKQQSQYIDWIIANDVRLNQEHNERQASFKAKFVADLLSQAHIRTYKGPLRTLLRKSIQLDDDSILLDLACHANYQRSVNMAKSSARQRDLLVMCPPTEAMKNVERILANCFAAAVSAILNDSSNSITDTDCMNRYLTKAGDLCQAMLEDGTAGDNNLFFDDPLTNSIMHDIATAVAKEKTPRGEFLDRAASESISRSIHLSSRVLQQELNLTLGLYGEARICYQAIADRISSLQVPIGLL